MLTDKTKGELMMLLSCLQEIAQKIGKEAIADQINEVQLRLQQIIGLGELEIAKENPQL